MKTHELKILPQYFQAVWNGTKSFELRKNDRDYQRGDILVLKEWDGKEYTGSALCVKVTYILQDAEKYGLQDGYIIMGIRHIDSNEDWKPQTNADRIRQMSDAELAKFLERFSSCETCFIYKNECGKEGYPCSQRFLEWLKSPEVDNGN